MATMTAAENEKIFSTKFENEDGLEVLALQYVVIPSKLKAATNPMKYKKKNEFE